MSGAAKRAATLRLKKRLTLYEAAYLVQEKVCGSYDDAVSLLIEAAAERDLPADIKLRINPYTADIIGPVEPSETTVATAEVVKWLGSLPRNDMPGRSEELAGNASSAKIEDDTAQEMPKSQPQQAVWKAAARQIGKEWLEQQRADGGDPGVIDVAKYVEGALIDKKITGARGKFLDWETIKREALTGITGRKATGKK